MEVSDGTHKRKIVELAVEIAHHLDEVWQQSAEGSESAAPPSFGNMKVEPSTSTIADVPTRVAVSAVDLNQNQNISIYHLLLDAQLDLKSDGQRIVCSKATNVQPRKRRKGPLSASTNMLPHQKTPNIHSNDPNRALIVAAFENALNFGEVDRLNRYFSENCHPDCILQIDLSALAKKYGVHIFREVRGVSGVQSYFTATMMSIPDAITFYQQTKITKLPEGGKEIEAQAHYMGIQVYEINVIDEEEVHNEQDRIAMAVAALIGGSTPSSDATPSSTSNSTSSSSASNNRRIRSLDSMPIFKAQGNVEFQCGEPLKKNVSINHRGTFTWQVGAHKKILKMKFTLMDME
jgi:hypothetical protein